MSGGFLYVVLPKFRIFIEQVFKLVDIDVFETREISFNPVDKAPLFGFTVEYFLLNFLFY